MDSGLIEDITNDVRRILDRTSTLVIQMLKREEELENAKQEVSLAVYIFDQRTDHLIHAYC